MEWKQKATHFFNNELKPVRDIMLTSTIANQTKSNKKSVGGSSRSPTETNVLTRLQVSLLVLRCKG